MRTAFVPATRLRAPSLPAGLSAARAHPWVLRAAWVALPFAVGPALGAALDPRSAPVRTVASVGLWAGWAVVLVATLVPHPVGCTALRLGAPAVLASAVAAALAGEVSALALGWAVLTAAVVAAPETGRWAVNGPAYPNEARFLLRAPGALLLGPLAVAWALAVGPPVVGALLVAAGRPLAGAVALAVAAPLSFLLGRAMHGLSRRWVVFVPAGVVLHDPLALADPVLFRRPTVASLGPAPAGTDALDLTQQAPGLALELSLKEKTPMVLVRPGRRGGSQQPGASARLVFTPTRPGAVLAEAARRRLPVG